MQIKPEKSNMADQIGLVISYFGSRVAVEAEHHQLFQCYLRRNQTIPVVGDQVTFQPEGEATGVVTGILPRRSVLSRGTGHGQMKAIAANLDLLLIVMAPPPIFSEYLLDRYLIAAELLAITPVIILNKIDLLAKEARQAADLRLQPYRQIPYQLIVSSVMNGEGLLELQNLLVNKTAVLVGSSGVGKSSMIAALGGSATIRVNAVSAKGIGKHTTTATRLYHLGRGAQLIDSPGVREFSLWPVDRESVLRGFKEFEPFVSHCKFRDCKHLQEPNCGVHAAVAAGKISPLRYASYQKLVNE